MSATPSTADEPRVADANPPSAQPAQATGAKGRPNDASASSLAQDADEAATPLEVTLPCGLRVVAAQDKTLPVAAVVMAYEVGTEDDPKGLDGLVHALAYHLQMGGRDLAPGDAIGGVADVGGWSSMAVGSAQVRFASVVPDSHLERAIWIESERARAPTTDERLFKRALGQARGDGPLPGGVPRAALAAAWRRASLQSAGRKPSAALSRLDSKALGTALAETFELRAATLVLVSARAPSESIALATKTFSDLPAQPRKRRTTAAPAPLRGQAPSLLGDSSSVGPDTDSTNAEASPAAKAGVSEGAVAVAKIVALPPPSEVSVDRAQAGAMVWPLAPTQDAIHWAEILCDGLGAQTRARRQAIPSATAPPQSEAAATVPEVRCRVDADPRRPAILIRLGRGGPSTLEELRERVNALIGADLALLVSAANRNIRRERAMAETSLGFAVAIAVGDPAGPASIGETKPFHARWLDLVHVPSPALLVDGPIVLEGLATALPQVLALEGFVTTIGRVGPPLKTPPVRGTERCDPVHTPGGCP